MSRLRWAAALCAAAIMAIGAVTSAAAAPARHGGSVAAQVDGQTYVLLGPSVFGVTVQQDPLAYHAIELADGTVFQNCFIANIEKLMLRLIAVCDKAGQENSRSPRHIGQSIGNAATRARASDFCLCLLFLPSLWHLSCHEIT